MEETGGAISNKNGPAIKDGGEAAHIYAAQSINTRYIKPRTRYHKDVTNTCKGFFSI